MNASDPGERSSRVEREILEILERADASQTPVENLQSAVRRKRASVRVAPSSPARTAWSLPAISPELAKIGGALVLAICAALIADYLRFLAVVLAIGSAGLFFSLWVPARPSGLSAPPRWRGQRLDDAESRFGFGSGRTPPWRGPKRPPR